MDTQQGHSGEHGCGDCHGHGVVGDMCGHRHWQHVIIKVLVAIFIFWAGVQFGELKALVHSYFSGYQGYGMMGWNVDGDSGYVRSPFMMYGNTYGASGSPVQVRTMMGTTTVR